MELISTEIIHTYIAAINRKYESRGSLLYSIAEDNIELIHADNWYIIR